MSRRRSRTFIAPLIVALAALLVMAAFACGADDEPDAPEQPAAPAAAAPAAQLQVQPGAPSQPQEPAKAAAALPAMAAPTAAPGAAAPVPTQVRAIATAAPAAAMVARSGKLTVATGDIGSTATSPQDCPACWFLGKPFSVWDPLLFQIRDTDRTIIISPALGETWEVASDNSYTEFKLVEGVRFHGGWGELTTADVAFSFDQANHNINPDSINAIGTEFVNFILEPIEVLDTYTFRIPWESHLSFTELKLLTKYFKTMGFFSKKVHDDMGADWMRDNFISTGPFMLEQWTEHDRAVMEAHPDYWGTGPFVANFTTLEVGENSTRRAMLETRQAQIAEIDVKDWKSMLGDRFKKAPEGTTTNYGIIMGGNYWETTHPLSGTALTREIPTDKPWVGDPADPASMEQSRKVRLAMSMAIDREGINASIFDGLGQPAYQGGIDMNDPLFKDEWKVEYDPDGARKLLAEAGYPGGGFTVDFYGRSKGSQDSEIAQAVAAGWRADLGIETNLINQPYATYRPNYINRTSYELSFRAGGGFAPATWQEEWLISATLALKDGSMGGGFNSGIEYPPASDSQDMKNKARTNAELVAAVNHLYDNMTRDVVWPSTVQMVITSIYDSEAIADWPMRPGGGIGEVELVKLR